MYSEPSQRSKTERFGKIVIASNYFCKKPILNLWEGSEYMSDFEYSEPWIVRALNIRKFLLIWRGSESEYASGCNNGRILNIPGFHVSQVSAYVSVLNIPEYGWIMQFSRVLNMPVQRLRKGLKKPPVLNIPGLRVWQSCKYAKVTQGAEYAWISLKMLK